jgi:hypothetical protein
MTANAVTGKVAAMDTALLSAYVSRQSRSADDLSDLYEIGAAWNGFVKQFTGPFARLKAFWTRSGRTPIRTCAPVG